MYIMYKGFMYIKKISESLNNTLFEEPYDEHTHYYDIFGYDKEGYDQNGYNQEGFNRDGYDGDGFSRTGYDKEGYDRDGFNRYGYDRDQIDRNGYDLDGYNREGFNRFGYDKYGYNSDGYKSTIIFHLDFGKFNDIATAEVSVFFSGGTNPLLAVGEYRFENGAIVLKKS